jgi:hypothetical protein
MTVNDDEVQDLINQLKELQILQERTLARLEEARSREEVKRPSEGKESIAARHRALANGVRSSEEDIPFAIGDRVVIKNPSHFQANRGTVVTISKNRITVLTEKGTKILRAPRNLRAENA